jgi:CDP-paratose 2-epimerase
MRLLITGGCGFLGSNLAKGMTDRGHEVLVFDNLSRTGSTANLAWLQNGGSVRHLHGDIRNQGDVERVVRLFEPEAVFHLAGQVAMTTSIADPKLDFETNALGSFLVLDTLRRLRPECIVLYSSTNKVYGDLEWVQFEENDLRYVAPAFPTGFPETIPFDPVTPYGVSKGAADTYMRDFHRIYGLRTVVFRHSSMYGGRQYATADQGWIGWFAQKALEAARGSAETVTFSGTGKQVRDVLHSDDIVKLYASALEHADQLAGQAYNVGGGMENSLSLLELFQLLREQTGAALNVRRIEPRLSDQRVFVADNQKVHAATGWRPTVSKDDGIARTLAWLAETN